MTTYEVDLGMGFVKEVQAEWVTIGDDKLLFWVSDAQFVEGRIVGIFSSWESVVAQQ